MIVTKLDGHAKGGGAISAVAATNSPIIFLGTGEHFDDFEAFNAKSFVSKLLGFGDIRGFQDDLKTAMGTKKAKEMQQNIAKGKYTLRDMYVQLETMGNAGTMSKMMECVPGMKGAGGGSEGMMKRSR